jgi:hypothetical protein
MVWYLVSQVILQHPHCLLLLLLQLHLGLLLQLGLGTVPPFDQQGVGCLCWHQQHLPSCCPQET